MVRFHDKEIEFSVLSAAIFSPEALIGVTELDEDDFYDNTCKSIFRAIKTSWENERNCSLVLVRHQIKKEGKLNDGAIAEIIERIAKSMTVVNVKRAVEIIREYSQRRKLYLTLSKAREMAGDLKIDNDDIHELIGNHINAGGIEKERIFRFSDLAKNGIEYFYDHRYVKTGFPDIDKKILGFFSGELIIIAARPSLGKSTLGLQIAGNIGINGQSVLFFSLEMLATKLGIKQIARYTKINSKLIQSGDLSQKERDKIMESFPKIDRENVIVIEKVYGLNRIISIARKMAIKEKLSAIVIDYLQLVQVKSKEDRHLQVGEISRSLKILAGELELPVIAMAQLNRTADNATPKLSDLRESGNIEQDADQVIFIDIDRDKERKSKMKASGGPVNIIFAKNRMGETGYCRLYYDKRFSEFSGIETKQDEQIIDSMAYIHQ